LGLDNKKFIKALKQVKSLGRKKILMYFNTLGDVNKPSPINRDRSLYINKEGVILNDRMERIKTDYTVTDCINDLWLKKFSNEWAFRKSSS